MIMSSGRDRKCVTLLKQSRIFENEGVGLLPDTKRRKVDRIRPFRKNCRGGGGMYDEDCNLETANKRGTVGSLDYSEFKVSENVKCGPEGGNLVGSRRIDGEEAEEGEIVEEDGEDRFSVRNENGIAEDEKREWFCENRSESLREVEEGEIIEDDVSDYVDDVSGKGDVVEKETATNLNSQEKDCYNVTETNLPNNRIESSGDVEEGEITEGDVNDYVEVASGKGADVHVTEINLKNQEMICYKEKETNLTKNRIAPVKDVEDQEIIESDVNDCVEVPSVMGAEVKNDKNVHVTETNLNNQETVCYCDQSGKSQDYTMIDDSERCTGYKFKGEINSSKMTKTVPRKQGKRVSDCAPTTATLGRCKAHADGSDNLTVKPKRTSVSKMNFAKRVSVLDSNGKGKDTLVEKESNDMSIGPSDSQETPIRSKVKETLNMFQQVLQKLLLSKEKVSQYTYVEAAMQLKEQGKWVNMERRILGAVPGVEVGDRYHCRAELVIIGLHHPFAAGIDSMEVNGKKIAISIVASGRYANETEFTDVLIYSGEGGNPAIKDRELKDQTLERGNLALKNSMDAETPVRVVRGYRAWKSFRAGDKKREKEATFTYDGLYVVSKYWQEKGRHGNLIYMFRLDRLIGQPKLTANSLSSITEKSKISGGSAISSVSSKSRKCKKILSKIGRSKPLNMPGDSKTLLMLEKYEVKRNPILLEDISYGKEKIAIRVINDIDDAKPPVFNYIANMVYPHLRDSSTKTKSCQCIDGCSDSVRCYCVGKNRGKVPFNEHGAILRPKAIIYECGPSCKCPPSCHNRVSQLGLKFQLEVFRTESVGWGLRSRDFIPSGSFICEYVGELLDDMQAEERRDCDEYLFNLGGNDEYTIDAGIYGNVGRFLNHSCSPNLYAQNVLYDHGDKRMPHVMLFATRDISPLEGLTFDYNYTIDSVNDANGNVKTKICCCGASDCRGRMY